MRIRNDRWFLLIVLAAALTGCSFTRDGIQVKNAWVRAGQTGSTAGAFALIENQGEQNDRLLGAECAVARAVEIHETTMEGDIMRMRPVESIDIPAGEQVELKPGGYHIMLIDLQRDLKVGEKITLTLVFENAGKVSVDAEVREP
jgi:copper(I)-binding protein